MSGSASMMKELPESVREVEKSHYFAVFTAGIPCFL
jgi:hypothetical protein